MRGSWKGNPGLRLGESYIFELVDPTAAIWSLGDEAPLRKGPGDTDSCGLP